jgi:hypothetical protein
MSERHEIKFRSYDRFFPNQDTMPKGGFGNLIALPLQKEARKDGNSVFVDEDFHPYDEQTGIGQERGLIPQGQLTLTMSANEAVREDLLHFLDVLQKAA